MGPAEILERLSAGRYRIAGLYGEQQVESLRLKPYNPPLTHGAPPLHFYTDKEMLVDDEKFIVEIFLKHTVQKSRGKEKARRPNIVKWFVKYKAYDKPEWREASEFMHDINEEWLRYNIKHKIDVGLKDIRQVLSSVHPKFLQWRTDFGQQVHMRDHRCVSSLCHVYYRL